MYELLFHGLCTMLQQMLALSVGLCISSHSLLLHSTSDCTCLLDCPELLTSVGDRIVVAPRHTGVTAVLLALRPKCSLQYTTCCLRRSHCATCRLVHYMWFFLLYVIFITVFVLVGSATGLGLFKLNDYGGSGFSC